jgi:hypothetical protein
MADPSLPALDRLMRHVRRRMFLRTLVHALLQAWTGALLIVALWFLAQPMVLADLGVEWKWGVAGGLVLLASALGFGLACWQNPPLLAAALSLDEKLGLKERVTTLLTLSPEHAASPAGLALRADVEQKLKDLDLAGKFPLRVAWTSALIPVCAAVLAVVAFFFEPFWNSSRNNANADVIANAKEIEQQLDNLKKVSLRTQDPDQPKSEDLKELEAAWDKLVKQPPPKTEDQIRDRVKEIQNLEDKLKDRIQKLKEIADKNKDLKKQLKNISADPNKTGPKEGRDLQEALAKGQLDKAIDALDRLAKKLQDKKLSKEERDKLAQQLHDLQDKLQRLADQKEQKDKLQRDFEKGKMTREELERELDKLTKKAEELKDLQDLADILGQCKDCLGRGDMKALERLRQLRGKLKAIQLTEDELKELLESQANLKDAEDALLLALNRCRGNCEGNMNGLGDGGPPGTRRPMGKDPKDSKIVGARQDSEPDPKGDQFITGFVKGGVFSRIPARDVGGAFKQAVQDAPEAIDRQRIPPDAADMAKGYFQRLGGQKN